MQKVENHAPMSAELACEQSPLGEGPHAKAWAPGGGTSSKLGHAADASEVANILSRAEIRVPIPSIAVMTALCS